MKLLRILLALFLLAVPLAAHAQNFPKRDREPVVDAANLLDPQQEAQIAALAEDIHAKTTRQFVVATIPSLEGYPIEDYGYRLGRAWGIGQKDANNGIILIVAPKERRVRIEVGYGLEPIMTDAMSSMIVNDTILPRFKAGDMPGGIVAGAQAIAEQMKLPLEAAEARAKEQADKASTKRAERRNRGGGFPWGLAFWGIVLVVILIPMFVRGFGRQSRQGPWGPRRYRGGDDGGALPVILWTIASELSRGSGSSGSSGWGGGSGGGGSDWGGGGGGGGFSGGGGSFGGGGASGSW